MRTLFLTFVTWSAGFLLLCCLVLYDSIQGNTFLVQLSYNQIQSDAAWNSLLSFLLESGKLPELVVLTSTLLSPIVLGVLYLQLRRRDDLNILRVKSGVAIGTLCGTLLSPLALLTLHIHTFGLWDYLFWSLDALLVFALMGLIVGTVLVSQAESH